MPANLKPEAVATPASAGDKPDVDWSLAGLITHWRIVVAELANRGVDLYDPAVLARPWPGVRTQIFSLIEQPTALRRALTRR